MKLALIGGGQMGRAIVGGMVSAGVLKPADLSLFDPSMPSQQWWKEQYPEVQLAASSAAAVDASEIVLLAVKPNVVLNVLEQDRESLAGKLVISIAAGVGLGKLTELIGHGRVVRVMPNTPSLVGQGATAYCCASDVSESDKVQVRSMLESVGALVAVTDAQMDAVTGLSGSGPAYVYLFIEALADGGVLAGLPRAVAMQLATQTVLGTAAMVAGTGKHPGELKDAVASPGGTTIAAIHALEQNGFRGAVISAVKASADRSRDLR